MLHKSIEEINSDIMKEIYFGKKPKLKVHPLDDRMMEDGTLNLDHPTLRDDYMSVSEFNARQIASRYH